MTDENVDRNIKALSDMISKMVGEGAGEKKETNLDDLIKQVIGNDSDRPSDEKIVEILTDFVQHQCAPGHIATFGAGDLIEPTAEGRVRYNIRKVKILMVSEVFTDYRTDDDDDRVHGEIVHYDPGRKCIVPHNVDFRFFKVIKKATKTGGDNGEKNSA